MISEQSQESALSTVKNVAQNLKKKERESKRNLKWEIENGLLLLFSSGL